MRTLTSYFDGRWQQGAGAEMASIDPADESLIGQGYGVSSAQIDLAVTAARGAFDTCWRNTTPRERAGWLEDMADAIEDNRSLLTRIEVQDTGLPVTLVDGGHITRAIDCFRQFARAILLGSSETFTLDNAYSTHVEQVPLGVVAVVAPWNAPLAVAAMNVAAALAAGNCVILKPSERTPLSALVLAEIADALALPAGVFSVIQGDGSVGQQLAGHPGIDGLCFVGGLENGRKVLDAAGRSLKRVLLELGGTAPTIVCAGADLEAAVDGALLSAYSSNGQVCTAGAHILVARPLYSEFAARLADRVRRIRLGPPLESETELGPLIDARHRAHVAGLVDQAVSGGAALLASSSRPVPDTGFYHPAVLLANLSPDMALARTEVFGPVAWLAAFDDEDEAVRCASPGRGGLAATVWTDDVAQGLRIARRLDCGGVAINAPFVRDIRAPFGGTGLSGLGRVGGRWSIEAYSEPRTICHPLTPFALPRYGLR